MFGWLLRIFRKLEKSLEKKIEGQDSGVNPHYLEASRAAQRIMLDNKVKIDGMFFIPNLILVPFSKAKKVPDSYVSNLIENVKNSTEANVYKTLALCAESTDPEAKKKSIPSELGVEEMRIWSEEKEL